MITKIKYRLQQTLPDGRVWISSETYENEPQRVVQAVVAGFLFGQPRAAVEEGSGRVIFALNARGHATADAARLFKRVDSAPRAEAASWEPAST